MYNNLGQLHQGSACGHAPAKTETNKNCNVIVQLLKRQYTRTKLKNLATISKIYHSYNVVHSPTTANRWEKHSTSDLGIRISARFMISGRILPWCWYVFLGRRIDQFSYHYSIVKTSVGKSAKSSKPLKNVSIPISFDQPHPSSIYLLEELKYSIIVRIN